MDTVLGYIMSLINGILHLFWISRKPDNSLMINIKSNTGNTVCINLDPNADIKNVKEIVAPKLGLKYEEVKIIFAGKELEDTTMIADCDLGQQSILHAVKSSPENNKIIQSKPMNSTLTDFHIQELDEDAVTIARSASPELPTDEQPPTLPPPKAHFYVYCNYECKSLQTGKLRVRCAHCDSGAVVVDRDPQSWSDVLSPQQISCYCTEPDCETGPVSWAKFYFKCSNHTSPSIDKLEQCLPLSLVTSNVRKIPCLACTDVCDPVLIFPCPESHVTCVPCFILYVTSRLRERNFRLHPEYGYTLPCPAGCPDSLISGTHHFKLLSSELYAQYQRFATEDFVLRNGGVLCPIPGCGAGIFPDGSGEGCNRIGCVECGFVFCRTCLQGAHIGPCDTERTSQDGMGAGGGEAYAVDPTRASQARWDDASQVTIKVSTKPCPSCRTATERAGGCMHMICTRCSFPWCWVCQVEWSRECMGSHWFG
uniref:E3 ubiquitin-protein ligase parkin n=1 Tax=Cacopsylla melanoneura TaxID=428564 RepID=A0A8D9DW11_9HEMI